MSIVVTMFCLWILTRSDQDDSDFEGDSDFEL